MTQRLAANPKLASKIQNDASWSDAERKFLLDYVSSKSSSAAPSMTNPEADKENVPNYNPKPVLRPFLQKVRTYEKPRPAPKKQKTSHDQSTTNTNSVQPQQEPTAVSKSTQSQAPTKDPMSVQESRAASKPPSTSLPPILVPPAPRKHATTTTTTAPAASTSGSGAVIGVPVQFPKDTAPPSTAARREEELIAQRMREIKERIPLLEKEREEKIQQVWSLFQEADDLQKKKIELREECYHVSRELEREIFVLAQEHGELSLRVARKMMNQRQ